MADHGQSAGIRIVSGQYPYDVAIAAHRLGDDVNVCVYGGSRHHVGAVAVAVPRPSLRDPAQTSSTASVITLPGHKEDQAARDLALRLAAALGAVVVVTAGIHVDAADEAGIERIMANFEDAALQLLNRFRK